ncbi:magnesium/cobalt transporter CorA [Tenacibaculum piscium]|uniref:Magnesium transport protein CorA n=1 Tax=Tenacibaculum piscium TaxID=1458515 RepID=A0A2H1YKC4_9FLAO|nr:magnesium/cobalt transporter CorA [Tenacibaculum piscium]MBE7629264.1 magnesium/cobalt transporter CorA [Tenacibaculum piscium]MBE7670051.1 magnesium/cobalt transporter CorA [Tenacibaculum piscium]SOS75945.1 Magnesium transport protein CorA [Tenacibaculum piscium]
MARIIKKKKQDIGLSPDELIFRGEQKTEEILFRVIDFDAQNLTENTTKKVKGLSELQHSDSVTWLNLDGLHNMAVMQEISSVFKFSPLVMAEVLNTDARPRVIEYENCTLISIKMLMLNEKNGKTTVENLSLILTEKLLFSFQEQKGDVFEPVRERIRKQKKRIRTAGTDYLTFALLDIVVDNYLYVLGFLGDKIETLEENLLINPTQNIITEINNYKRELNFLRKNIKPAKEMIFSLAKTDTDFIKENTYIYFKELEDNISQANDATDNYREILSDQLNIYHTTISSKLNDIMRFLTIFSVIFIPLTFIAGIYGTNFEYIPELSYKYSYFIMWGIMLVTAIAMLLFFKNKKWF